MRSIKKKNFFDPAPIEELEHENVTQLPLEESGIDIDENQRLQEQQEQEQVRHMQTLEQDKQVPRHQRTGAKSLFLAKQIPELLRYILPAFIVATIAILISSNLSVGAFVEEYIKCINAIGSVITW